MAVIRIGDFVRSGGNALGIGKLREIRRDSVTVEYFLGPGCAPRLESVPQGKVSRAILDCETRVYELLPNGIAWRAGRALAESGEQYLVQFPNIRTPELVATNELFTRCDLPIPDPTVFLAARITETPLWHQRRAGFVRTAIEQRRACAGMTGLLSSCIDLEPHQIEVVRRVLLDPVQRYLLADEVGLGKTIEAGVVIRQYVLEHPISHKVVVLVPSHLEQQWWTELTQRFGLGPFLDESVRVLPHDTSERWDEVEAKLVVIDEAHQVARWVAAETGSRQRRRFDALRKVVTEPGVRLLLLSATPTLHSEEVGFQALLHLLDPVVYPLGDLAGFRNRLQQHETVAQLYHQFRPEEQGGYLEDALDQFVSAFPADIRLSELAGALRPFLAYGTDPDALGREESIRAVRAHMSEAYRLHRRLLRNRRADDRVEGLLPGRIGAERWTYSDPETAHVASLLDEWRIAVAASAEPEHVAAYGRVFVLFAEAATCDADALAGLVAVRLGEDNSGRLGLYAGDASALTEAPLLGCEETILERLRGAATSAASFRRIEALTAGLERLFSGAKPKAPGRAVVFASYPQIADEVFGVLRERWPGEVLRHGQSGWRHFRTTPSFRVLVCDRTAEEGLNLHSRGTVLVHFDLPWSPNRVEQRVGRLDRYGVATPVRSVVLVAEGDALAAVWVDYLDRAYQAFDRSVAALQYLTENELAQLYPAVLAEGSAAVAAATDRLAGPEGVVELALRDIRVLDELDAVEAPPGHEQYADTLRQTDDLRRADWQSTIHTWVGETLQFARRFEGTPTSNVWRYQFQRPHPGGPSTLMPVDRLVRHFGHIIDTEDERSTPQTPLTYPLAFDRGRAQNQRVALARIGDPFLDALVEYVNWDDRGTCSAQWRYRPSLKAARPAEVAYRFEFVVECPVDGARAAMPTGGAWSGAAVRRQADWLFPPFPICVWLDQYLESVTDLSKLAILAEEYSKKRRPDGGRDFNLNADRWAAIEPHFPRADWALQVQSARSSAEQQMRGTAEWTERIASRLSAARRAAADRDAQTASRLTFLIGQDRTAEQSRARIEEAVSVALLNGIENPSVRLDSVSAVFLADWNPFTDMDE